MSVHIVSSVYLAKVVSNFPAFFAICCYFSHHLPNHVTRTFPTITTSRTPALRPSRCRFHVAFVSMLNEAEKVFKNQIGFTTFSLKRENCGKFSDLSKRKTFQCFSLKKGFNLFIEAVEVDVLYREREFTNRSDAHFGCSYHAVRSSKLKFTLMKGFRKFRV